MGYSTEENEIIFKSSEKLGAAISKHLQEHVEAQLDPGMFLNVLMVCCLGTIRTIILDEAKATREATRLFAHSLMTHMETAIEQMEEEQNEAIDK